LRVGIALKEKDVDLIISLLNSRKEIKVEEILFQMLRKNISSSDILFILLQILGRDGFIEGSKGVIKIIKPIDEKEAYIAKKRLIESLSKSTKVFVTPLEIGKFFQCPRRIWLEKVVMSTQKKEEKGKAWDGEALHFAINQLVKNLEKGISTAVEDAVNSAVSKYAGKIELEREKLVDFLNRFCEFMKEEGISTVFTEKLLESFPEGLVGTPDLIGISKDGKIITIDIKLGQLSRKGLKKEHLLQIVGEAILAEKFFRKRVEIAYLIYFESNSLAKIIIREDMKREFLKYKRGLIKTFRSSYIPPVSRLPNFKKRVCQGCHVRHVCENIELLKKI